MTKFMFFVVAAASLPPSALLGQDNHPIVCSCQISVVCGADACSPMAAEACEDLSLRLDQDNGGLELCMHDGCSAARSAHLDFMSTDAERLTVYAGTVERIGEPDVDPYYTVATLSHSWRTVALSIYGEDGPIHSTLSCVMQ